MKLIHHVVDIDAATTTVWAALTVAHGLASWWNTRLSTPEAEVGAQQHWTFRASSWSASKRYGFRTR